MADKGWSDSDQENAAVQTEITKDQSDQAGKRRYTEGACGVEDKFSGEKTGNAQDKRSQRLAHHDEVKDTYMTGGRRVENTRQRPGNGCTQSGCNAKPKDHDTGLPVVVNRLLQERKKYNSSVGAGWQGRSYGKSNGRCRVERSSL